MDELNGDRTFTYTGCHPLHRTVAHVTYRKESWNICLEQKRIPIEHPALRALAISQEIRTRQDEPVRITLDDISQPVCAWGRSNKNEHGARRYALHLVGIRTKK
jgi:DNA-binding helix-hairpin-helix protein with protein kinase domain